MLLSGYKVAWSVESYVLTATSYEAASTLGIQLCEL